MRPAARLLEMGGTLVDSHAAVEAAWSTWARENDLDPVEVLAYCHGRMISETVRHFRPDLREEAVARAAAGQLDRECTDVAGVRPAEGADAHLSLAGGRTTVAVGGLTGADHDCATLLDLLDLLPGR